MTHHDTFPRHTPYDGSGRAFQIGLTLMGEDEWLDVDTLLAEQLDRKDELFATHPGQVWREEPASRPAQEEVLAMVIDDLSRRHSDSHIFSADGSTVTAGGRTFSLTDPAIPPLRRAARIVQEDLLILEQDAAGWRLTAASLSFPSSWSLPEKIGRPMNEIHDPVPGFGTGTRNDTMIRRIFDNLPVDKPVKRMNWSINNTDELFLPGHHAGKDAELDLESVHVRVERQSLRKLARTGAIVFAIRIHVDRLADIMAAPGAAKLAPVFADQILALDRDQVAYKGFSSRQQALADRIMALAGLALG